MAWSNIGEHMTLVVNLFGGPGVGKSTTAALTFAQLKQDGVNVEIAHEYAKDLTWEDRHKAMRYQPYVAAKQMWRIHRLIDQVDVVITDSPILLSLVYGEEEYGCTQAFEDFVLDTFRRWRTLNYLLERIDYQYQPVGRRQTEDEAKKVDAVIKHMLKEYQVTHCTVGDGGRAAIVITNNIIRCLEANS